MKKIIIATAITAGMTLSGTAMAGALETTPETQSFSFTTLVGNTDLSYAGFDASLGVLHSVHIEYTLDKVLNNDIINTNAGSSTIGSPTPVSATSETTFTISTAGGNVGGLSDVSALTTPGFSGSVPGGGAITTVGTAADANITGMKWICDDGSCLAGGGTAVTSAELASFVGGTNTLNVNVDNQGVQGGSVPPGVFTGNNGTVDGTVSVIYDYDTITTVPEPTSIALLGLGLTFAGLQTVARRRKQA